MKLVVLLIFITCFQANAVSYAQTLSLNKQNASLVDIFREIKKQTDYNVICNAKIINESPLVSVNLVNASLEMVLNRVLVDNGLSFVIENRTIVVSNKKTRTEVKSVQDITVRGNVKDKINQPLVGVSVSEKGTKNIVTTNTDGNYAITVKSSESTLTFSYIGYVTKEVKVSSSNLNVLLEEDLVSLNDVVIVGYGTQKKENLTGSISTVSSEDLVKRPVMRATAALQGLAPGLTIIQRSGQPGSDGASIRIRGVGTLGDSSPLVLIDGVEGSLDGVDANDIASISVLKDAASASIYGSRAANGVILVTTKSGIGAKLSVGYNSFFGWQKFTELPEYADGYTYMSKLNEAYRNMGKTPLYSDAYLQDYLANKVSKPDQYPDTDWQKAVYSDNGAVQNHYLSVSGGEKVNIHSSFGYQDQKGVIPHYSSKRYSFRLNAKMNILANLQATVLLNGRHSPIHTPANIDDIIIGVNRTAPIYAAQFSDGRYGAALNGFNPLAQINAGGTGVNTYDNFRSTFQANYQPITGMDLELSFTPEFNLSGGKRFTKALETFEYDSQTPAFTVPTRTTLTQSHSKSWENTLRLLGRYSKEFGDHSFKLLAGFEQIDYNMENMVAGREGFPFTDYQQLDAGSIEFMTNSGSAAQWALRSAFSRLNYSFKNKYLLEANIRLDGSSRFYEGYKWGTFPSFSAGWRISQEEFLKDSKFISEMKLRASWGKLGNQLIGNYPFASVIDLSQSFIYGAGPVSGGSQLDMANTFITWESTTSSNIGLDVGLWNNRVDFTFDYYVRNTSDILLKLPIPALIGQVEPYQNAGKVKNTGWDFAINYNQAINNFKFRVGLNLSDVKNEVVDLKGAGPIISSYNINDEGLPINSMYGYKALGLFQSQEEIDSSPKQIGIYAPGDIKYFDANGDGTIGSDDRVPIGNAIPRYTYGLNFNAEFKGFDFSFLIQGTGKADVLLNNDAAWAFYNAGKIKTWQLDSWTPQNTGASYPRLIAERTHNNYENSSYWVYNASYIRLKNVQLGYTLPKSLMNRLPLNKVRIFATADNLWTRHQMPQGWDPERPNGNATTYPITSTYTFGINVIL